MKKKWNSQNRFKWTFRKLKIPLKVCAVNGTKMRKEYQIWKIGWFSVTLKERFYKNSKGSGKINPTAVQ